MSAFNLRASGGSKDLLGQQGEVINTGLFITNTKVGKMKSVHEKGLSNLITNTTGTPAGRPIMEGVLTSTKQGIPNKDVPELQKTHNKGKTQPKRTGQVPFAGPKY